MKDLTRTHIYLPSMLLLCSMGCRSEQEKPANILLIVVDDAGYNDFGFKGSTDLETPNIDKLAATGVIFSDAHVSASVSGPSRAGLLCGRYQQRSGYECNLEDTLGLGLAETTIGDIFSEAGYVTSCIGKWHQGNAPAYHPNQRGFDHFFGFISGSRSYFYRPNGADRPGALQNLQCNGTQIHFDGYLTDVLAEAANKQIDSCVAISKPFMMYLAFNAVHTPLEATEADMTRYEGHPRQQLAAMTWALDRAVGSVVDNLKAHNIFDNTLIFFVSDNGGAHNNQSCNAPLKGFKGNKFEGGHRVPFFITYGNKFAGATYSGLTSSLDILPTAAAVADIDISSLSLPLDGVDIIPYITGDTEGEPHDMLFWRKEDMAAVRMGDYKLIRVEGVGTRLYNLKENLGETVDLQYLQPDIYNQMLASLEEWEEGLVNPLYWDEGVWTNVTREIHRDLMENRPVERFSPQ